MPGLQDVAERLSSAYDTRVTVSLGKRKGKIVVEFGSVDDLQRIVALDGRHCALKMRNNRHRRVMSL